VGLYLRAADVFALFSTYEGLPHTVLEAMQVGVPVVVSDAGGNTEVVTAGETGWVVKAGDVKALQVALSEALRDRDMAQRFTQAATAGLERFSWARLVEGYVAALRGLQ
jgi:glycosyltransferase involved in cell wall biosynthesis